MILQFNNRYNGKMPSEQLEWKNPFDEMNNYCLENDATFEEIITSLKERSCS